MAKQKVIDELNDGWKTVAPEDGGQIERVQSDPDIEDPDGSTRLPSLSDIPDDDEDEEELFDEDDEEFEDDEEEDENDGRPSPSTYHRYGAPYENTCIVCHTKFKSERPARFCVDKPGCRQKYNRQERRVKAAAACVDTAIGELAGLLDDQNFGQLARELLLKLERSMLQRLDDKLPDRHPKKELTARPVRVDPGELGYNDKAFVLLGSRIYEVNRFEADRDNDELIICRLSRAGNWDRLALPKSTTWLRVVEPE
jgi:hypothetical protein